MVEVYQVTESFSITIPTFPNTFPAEMWIEILHSGYKVRRLAYMFDKTNVHTDFQVKASLSGENDQLH